MVNDSLEIYKKACQRAQECQQIIQIYGRGSDKSRRAEANLQQYYIRLISTMFYELITKRRSALLSELCSLNGIEINLENITIDKIQYLGGQQEPYDLKPILDGLNAAFTEDLDYCEVIYLKNKEIIFKGRRFSQKADLNTWANSALKKLDDNAGRILSAGRQKELNKFAQARRAGDEAISEQIQQLQLTLQDELKQIMAIREGIDYNITQEAVSQLMFLYSLLSDTLRYHPDTESKESYHNLIESCQDLLENIMQSLTMLGVTLINDTGGIFDPEKHKTARGIQPERGAVISQVVKIGFIYKNKVLEKAEVELRNC